MKKFDIFAVMDTPLFIRAKKERRLFDDIKDAEKFLATFGGEICELTDTCLIEDDEEDTGELFEYTCGYLVMKE